MANYQPLGLNDTMPFGKHKGKTIQELINTEVDYIRWLLENSDSFELDEDADAAYTWQMENSPPTTKSEKKPGEKKQYQPLKLEDNIPFGKHKGTTISELISTKPDYVKWLLANVDTFSLTEEAEDYLDIMSSPSKGAASPKPLPDYSDMPF